MEIFPAGHWREVFMESCGFVESREVEGLLQEVISGLWTRF